MAASHHQKSNMYFYQYILLAGFTCLLFNKETRFASVVFLLSWVVYLLLFIDATVSYKYIACATLELSIAYLLNNRFRLVSYIGYFLIFVNIFGLMLYKNKLDPMPYDFIYAILSVTQLILLILRVNLNGLHRLHPEHIMVRIANFDGGQSSVTMHKTQTNKKTI
jgi:hypothetical protein